MTETAPAAMPGNDSDLPPEAYKKCTQSTVFTSIFGVILGVMALLAVINLIAGIVLISNPDGSFAQQVEAGVRTMTAADFYEELTLSLFMFGVIPVAWVALTRVDWWEGTLRYLYLTRPESIWKEIGMGVLIVLGLFIALIAVTSIQAAASGDWDEFWSENETELPELVKAMDRVMTWPLAIFIAFVAGVGEELFFRGLLQRWMGWWGQAIVFGVTHAGYGTVSQIVVPFGIGLLFGYLVHRGARLYQLMIAHFLFDFVQLAALAAN